MLPTADSHEQNMSSDQGITDQINLAELATAKLLRQQQRIINSDPALVTAAKLTKVGRKPKTEWKPTSLANSSDDNLSNPESIGPRNLTPFDVHAKVFRPGTAGSRESSRSRTSTSVSAMNTVRSVARVPSFLLDNDDGGTFQLVTGKKTKPKLPPLTLNAHQSSTTDSPSAISTNFNKKEINEVFGNDLPSPEFFQANTGSNGEVRYGMHPNGDVSAHQWSDGKYQWINIGHYSYSRRRREGICAATRLKGENEQQTLQQNSLAYFNAVCRQLEAQETGSEWGHKQINEYLPAPVASNLTTTTLPIMPKLSRGNTSLDGVSFGAFPAACPQSGFIGKHPEHQLSNFKENPISAALSTTSGNVHYPYSDTNPRAWHTMGPMDDVNVVDAAAAAEASGLWTWKTPKAAATVSNPARSTTPNTTSAVPTSPWPGANCNTESAVPSSPWFNAAPDMSKPTPLSPFVHSSFEQSRPTDRSAMKQLLNKLGETASARGSNAGNGLAPTARTVLHDPLKHQSAESMAESPLDAPSTFYYKEGSTGYFPLPVFHARAISPQLQQSMDQMEARRKLVGVSEPDPSPWNQRPHEVIDMETVSTSTLSDEQLALYSLPTPQNWNGPFFTGSPEKGVTKISEDEELREWFMGGNKRVRHDEVYEGIKARHKINAVFGARRHSPSPIGPPGAQSSSSQKREEPTDLDKGMTRALIPVIENLNSYVKGPKEQRHGFFARFTPPPEWCIDRGPNGNKSFFGDDWGHPPERISRDPRYRRQDQPGRFDNFEAQSSQPMQPAIGPLTGSRRGVQQLEPRFRVLGRKC